MSTVVAQDAEVLWDVGQAVPWERLTRQWSSTFGEGQSLTVEGFVQKVSLLELDFKLESLTLLGQIQYTVSLVDPQDRNPLGQGSATDVQGAFLAAFYDFFH